MIIRLTVRDPALRAEHDVEVTAEPDTPISSLLRALPVPVDGRPCFTGTGKLDPDATVADSPLVHGSVISVGEPERARPWRPMAAAGAVRVFSGPDAGRVFWLSPGRHVLGARNGDLTLPRDPAVRDPHAGLEVSWTGEVTVVDLGGGALVEETPVDGRAVLRPDSVLQIGDDRMRWAPLPPARLKAGRSRDGRIDFDRAFAPSPAVPVERITLPRSEATPRNFAVQLLSSLIPLPIAVLMAVFLQSPYFLLFGLLTPITFFGTQWVEGRQRKRKEREFAERKSETLDRMRRHVVREQWLRALVAPDEVDLTIAAFHEGPGLWPRNADSPDGLVLRVGVADERAAVELSGEPWEGFEEPMLRGVPVTVDLREIGVLGVIGPPPSTDALLRWLLVQLGCLRDPDELRLVVITASDGGHLAWTRWLPHLAGGAGVPCTVGNTPQTRTERIDELKDLVAERAEARKSSRETRFGEEIVVVLDGARALRDIPGMKEVLREGPTVGVYVICADQRSLNECRGVCELDGTRMMLTRGRQGLPTPVQPEYLGEEAAERIARALAPMRDRLTLARAENTLPDALRLLDVLGIGVPDADAVLARWAAAPGPTTAIPIGGDGAGPVTVDLAADGPHTMLGGATGAGKSILLQTLVTSLLLANRPDELNLVLVDFKGGSAFLPFEHCPHVVGLIRSTGDTPADVFDEAAALRVLASVRAEVRRREAILARYGGEIDAYWAAGGRLPRLVMVFDEFARVLETSPDFLRELVNVAAKGRSLGMHLVLATQSLQGKLSPELKNNISLRITLRQNEPSDSTEVLGVPDAARIPSRLRGRGMIMRVGAEQRTPQLFQTGYLGDPPPTGAAPAAARLVPWPTLGLPRPQPTGAPRGARTDQDLAIEAVIAASGLTPADPPFRPLLPPLPAALPAASLPAAEGIPYGLADDPANQAQPAMTFDPAGTERLMVAGGPQSGRTTFARTLISGLGPGQAWLYVIENQPGGLAAYASLPHCGAVVSGSEPDRIRRLVTWLAAETERRKHARTAEDPPILLVVDGWECFEDRSDPDFFESHLLVTLRGIAAAGPPVGVHVVAIGGYDMLRGKTPDIFSQRLFLPFPREETRRSHLSSGMVSPPVLPGRAIEAATGLHVQIALPGDPSPGPGLAARPFPPMPVTVPLAGLSTDGVPLGVGGPDVTPIGLDLFDAGPHLVLVSGPPGSGRSNAALVLATGLLAQGIPVLPIAPPRSPLARLPGALTGTVHTDTALREAVADRDRFAVVIDDFDQLTVTPTEKNFETLPTLLQELTALSQLGRGALVLCGDALPVLEGQRRSLAGVLTETLRSGFRLLLTPANRVIAREHGLTLEPDQFFTGPPGRAYLSVARRLDLIQLALHGP